MTEPIVFIPVAVITLFALSAAIACVVGAIIHYGIGEEDDSELGRGGSFEDSPPAPVYPIELHRRRRDLGGAA